jgi:UDP-N-acetylglucosamine 2-epimerase (non-hydrolysing)
MAEVIAANKAKIDASVVLEQLGIVEKRYIVLSAHREENVDNPTAFESLMSTVNALAEKYGLPVIYSVHPRSARLITEREFKFHALVREMPPFNFTDYSRLMYDAFCVVSDSGTLPEEAAISKFPAVSLRTSTERPEALEKGAVVIGGITAKTVLPSVELAVGLFRDGELPETVPDYEASDVSCTVARLIQGYTPIVNKNIWRGKIT